MFDVLDSVENIITAFVLILTVVTCGSMEINGGSNAPISFQEMVFLAERVSSFPDNISMDVADTASTLAVGFDADYPPTRLALYDADKLTLIDDGTSASHVTIQQLAEFMELKHFDLSGSVFDIVDTGENILNFLKSGNPDKDAILQRADDIEILEGSSIDLNVADAQLLATNSVVHNTSGYSITDNVAALQGEVTSESDLGVLANATSVNRDAGDTTGILDLTIAEQGALADGGSSAPTTLSVPFNITDTQTAIQDEVDSPLFSNALHSANSIHVDGAGRVELNAEEFGALRSKFASDEVELKDTVAALKSVTPTPHADVVVVAVAQTDNDLTTEATFLANVDQILLDGASNVTLDAAQILKLQSVTSPETFNIKDTGEAIINLHANGRGDLLEGASNVTASSAELSEAVKFSDPNDAISLLVDSYGMSSNAVQHIASNALDVAEAKAVNEAVTPPAYSIRDSYANIKALLADGDGSAVTEATTVTAYAGSIADAVEIAAGTVSAAAEVDFFDMATASGAPLGSAVFSGINMDQAEAVLGAGNKGSFKSDISISDSVANIQNNSTLLAGNAISPAQVHATGATVADAVTLYDLVGKAGQYAGSFDLDAAVLNNTDLTLNSLKEGHAVASALNNVPAVNTIAFSLDATEAITAQGALAPELTVGGAFAAAESVKVNNVSDVADAVLLFGSADVDEFSLAPSFVAPAEGVTIAEAQALFAGSGAGAGEALPAQPFQFEFPTAPTPASRKR